MSGSWAREGLLGWSAGLQEHPGEIKEQFDATVTREFGIFPFLVGFFFPSPSGNNRSALPKGAGGGDALWKGKGIKPVSQPRQGWSMPQSIFGLKPVDFWIVVTQPRLLSSSTAEPEL